MKKRKSKLNISNEVLAGLLVLAIGLSFINFLTLPSSPTTGYGTSEKNATAGVEILSVTSINWTTSSIDWGVGSVNPGADNATLDTDAGTVVGGNWTAVSDPLVLVNNGGDNVVLNMTSDKDASQFIGGPGGPQFKWKITEDEAGSCTGLTDGTWTNVSTGGKQICSNFNSTISNNQISMDIWVVIPAGETNTGAQEATITATAVSI